MKAPGLKRSTSAGTAVGGLIAVLIALHSAAIIHDCDSLRPVHTGQQAPDIALPRILQGGNLGETVTLASYLGKIVIIDFWATWCGPCQSSMPVLDRVAVAYADDVALLSINQEGPGVAAKASQVVARLSPNANLVLGSEEVMTLYNVTSIPHMVIVDQTGTVRWVHSGFGTKESLERDLREVIESLL